MSFLLRKAGSGELCAPRNFVFLVTLRGAKACVIVCQIVHNLQNVVFSISIENLSQKIYFELRASEFVTNNGGKKFYSRLRMEFYYLKVTEPLQGGSLLFITKSPNVPGTHTRSSSNGQ